MSKSCCVCVLLVSSYSGIHVMFYGLQRILDAASQSIDSPKQFCLFAKDSIMTLVAFVR